jgi:hypothetical protein
VVNIYTIKVVKPQYILAEENKTIQPLRVDISSLESHRFIKVKWHGLPIGIYKRTAKDFETINKRHPRGALSKNSKWEQILKGYLIENGDDLLIKKLKSINDSNFIFVMMSPVKACKLIVQFFHDPDDVNKDKSATIFGSCTAQTYDMNGKLALENFYGLNNFDTKLFTNHLLIPNHRYIDENTIEFYPNDEN